MGGYNLDHTATGREANILARWRDHAACYGMPDVMDPPAGHTTASERRALQVCAICPVVHDCAEWVMARREREDPGGVAGGMTERRRLKLRCNASWQRGQAKAAAS